MKEGYVTKSIGEDAADLARINRFTRRPFTVDEVYIFEAVLCDNALDRDHERFTKAALEGLAALFVGKTCIFDHERKSANQTARIFHAETETDETRKAEGGEPYTRLMARAYLPRTEKNGEVITLIESGILKEISVSCAVANAACSICGKKSCGHVKGRVYDGQTCHRVLDGPTDAYECSFVAVPAQRGAGVVKRYGTTEEPESRMDFAGDGETNPAEVWKRLKSGANPVEDGAALTAKTARYIAEKIRELEALADCGRHYRQRLETGVYKYSAVLQPEMPRAVMEAAVKGLSVDELARMEETYRKMAGQRLPLAPQLHRRKQDEEGGTAAFRVQ